ncbi:hypothetical protein [Shinella oryzae]|uniref:Uncharacterized protein n=1 Tax=Shinella oryzae TaxID=2871820 RepID=A0ABY9K3D6_9HYPH|nr:hypothetical protein [Shinella oryzae]WLS03102.1 hypothetical protein Q9315_00195 [Shinella oryzae]
MHILQIRRQPPGGKTLARFDIELVPGVKLYDLKLIRGERGYRVFGPSIGGGAAATFAPAVADQLVQLALGDVSHNDDRH